MIKWFAYIALLLLLTPRISLAKKKDINHIFFNTVSLYIPKLSGALADTTTVKNSKKLPDADDKKKIKEIAKAKRQPKPEKIITGDVPVTPKTKPKRQRRPEGLERPPEIPRRNGN